MDNLEYALGLADWRRRIAELYAEARANPKPLEAWRDWRVKRDGLFASHPKAPCTGSAAGRLKPLAYFDYDPSYRLLVEIDTLKDQDLVTCDLGRDGLMAMLPVGRTRGLAPSLGGELTVYWVCGYGGGIFLPFTDTTSGHETYGGGRYLLDGIKGMDLGMTDGRTVLDFNFAYAPCSAHEPSRICPPVPAENHLPASIRAGEASPTVELNLRERA